MASILAITASQSGPAHSFIIGEALQAAAARAGHQLSLKVHSHLGEHGSFSESELATADVAIIVADGPIDKSALPSSLKVFECAPQAVFDDADTVLVEALGDKATTATPVAAAGAATAAVSAAAGGPAPKGLNIVAITSCPTGVAHTFMAAEALEQGATEAGHKIKVETQGSVGAQNALTPAEIAAADLVVISADTQVNKDRFVGKRLYSTSTKASIRDAAAVINTAYAQATPWGGDAGGEAVAADKKDGESESGAKKAGSSGPYKHLMTGVSFMLPFVVAGGLLIALAFALGGIDAMDDANTGTAAWTLGKVGAQFAFTLMVPILAGYISFSIADRPGLAPGMVGGFIANTVGAGFLGGILAGFLAGYLTKFLNDYIKLPRTLAGLKPVLILPLLATGIVGYLMMAVLGDPMAAIMNGLTEWLKGMQTGSVVLLGVILGAMMGFDLGGPVNKAAYVFGTTLIASDITIPMAAVMAAGMVPPLGIAVACWLFRNRFSNEEREASKAAAVLGLSFITEGAIPFVARDPLRVIPACMIGAAVAGGLSAMFGVTLAAPHGGIFVLAIPGAVNHVLLYAAAIAAGAVACAVVLGVLKQPLSKQAVAATV
ncbi:MAG: fructose-specific PTS transporter subunit EIIC [Lautropia sp.]|nr:fructose-specific PTS transporter subunit EIIC [Lautropia sp.]